MKRLEEIPLTHSPITPGYKSLFLLARRVILAIRVVEDTIGEPTPHFREGEALNAVRVWSENSEIDLEELWTMVQTHFEDICELSAMDKAIDAWRFDPRAFPAPGLTDKQRAFATLLQCIADETTDGNPFLSCRKAEEITGIHYRMCARYLKALEKRGHLKIVKVGKLTDGATEYRMCHT